MGKGNDNNRYVQRHDGGGWEVVKFPTFTGLAYADGGRVLDVKVLRRKR